MPDLIPSAKNSCLLTVLSGAVYKTAGVPVFCPVNVHWQSFCWHIQQGFLGSDWCQVLIYSLNLSAV